MTNILKLLFSKDKELYKFYTSLLGVTPRNINYYKIALTHKSCSRAKHSFNDNERMEFLGDAILEGIVSDMLYKRYPFKAEGFLTQLRAAIVQRETLSEIAEKMELNRVLKVSSNIQLASKSNMYGNALEALIAAIYLDFGYNRCKQIVEKKILLPYLDLDQLCNLELNYKSKIIEWAQARHLTIHFSLENLTTDEENNKLFKSGVVIAGQKISTGLGISKKASHQNAARTAYELIKSDKELRQKLTGKR
ncbi:MAG: ribonuclease III [Bacteroidales bacterium]